MSPSQSIQLLIHVMRLSALWGQAVLALNFVGARTLNKIELVDGA